MTDAVRTVARGQGLIAPEVTRRLIGEFAASSPRPLPDTRLEQLGSDNRARVRVDVSLTDEAGIEVAPLIAIWAMRRLP